MASTYNQAFFFPLSWKLQQSDHCTLKKHTHTQKVGILPKGLVCNTTCVQAWLPRKHECVWRSRPSNLSGPVCHRVVITATLELLGYFSLAGSSAADRSSLSPLDVCRRWNSAVSACRLWENEPRFAERRRVKITFHYHKGNHYTMTTDTKAVIPAGSGFLKTRLPRHVLTTFL